MNVPVNDATGIVFVVHHGISLTFDARASKRVAREDENPEQERESEPSTSGISSSVRRRREIRRCLMPRLPRSVGNTYCGPQSRVVIFTVQTRRCSRGRSRLARDSICRQPPLPRVLRSALSLPSLSLSPCPCRRQPPSTATPGVSRSNARLFRRSFRILPPFNNPGIRRRKSARWYKRSDGFLLGWRDADPRFLWGSQKFIVVLPHLQWHRAGIVRVLGRASWGSSPSRDRARCPFARTREIFSFGENEFTCRDNVQRVGNHGLKREKGKSEKFILNWSKNSLSLSEIYLRKIYNYFICMRINIIYRIVNTLIFFL